MAGQDFSGFHTGETGVNARHSNETENNPGETLGPGALALIADARAIHGQSPTEAWVYNDDPPEVTSGEQNTSAGRVNSTNQLAWSRFTRCLYEMTSSPENSEALGFSSDGELLEIYNVNTLERRVLPRYFRHKNISSFLRQLNNYGFRSFPNTTLESSVLRFYHESFKKGRLDLIGNVKRRKGMENAVASASQTSDSDAQNTSCAETIHDYYESKLSFLQECNWNLQMENSLLREENARLKRMLACRSGVIAATHQQASGHPRLNAGYPRDVVSVVSEFSSGCLTPRHGTSSAFPEAHQGGQ